MKKIIYGYHKDQHGNITDRCELPEGEHKFAAGYTFVPVTNRDELDAVVITPPPPDPKQIREEKIRNEIRAMAIERLKARGEFV